MRSLELLASEALCSKWSRQCRAGIRTEGDERHVAVWERINDTVDGKWKRKKNEAQERELDLNGTVSDCEE